LERDAVIAVATTTITISRATPADDQDPYDTPAAPATTATGIRAVIGSESGRLTFSGSAQETVTWRLTADPCDLRALDLVVDDQTGDTYQVQWSRARTGLGLDHTEARLQQVSARNPVLA
jgi:hypothetical protein